MEAPPSDVYCSWGLNKVYGGENNYGTYVLLPYFGIIFPIFSGLAHVLLLLMSSKLLEDREVIVLDIPLHHTSVWFKATVRKCLFTWVKFYYSSQEKHLHTNRGLHSLHWKDSWWDSRNLRPPVWEIPMEPAVHHHLILSRLPPSAAWTRARSSWITGRRFNDSPRQLQKNTGSLFFPQGPLHVPFVLQMTPEMGEHIKLLVPDDGISVQTHVYCSSWYVGGTQRHSENWRVGLGGRRGHWHGQMISDLLKCYQVGLG